LGEPLVGLSVRLGIAAGTLDQSAILNAGGVSPSFSFLFPGRVHRARVA